MMRWRGLMVMGVAVGMMGAGAAVPKKETAGTKPAATAPAASLPAAPALEVGYRSGVAVPGVEGETYEVYVPRGEMRAGLRRPVLFVLGRSASLNSKFMEKMGLSGWAEETGAVVIGVNQMFVAQGPVTNAPAVGKAFPTEEAMDSYMAVADGMAGVHPSVRVVVCDDPALTGQTRVLAVGQRYPGKVGGILLGPRLYEGFKDAGAVRLGAGTGVAILSVTWEAYAKKNPAKPYVIGTDDVWGSEGFERTIGESMRTARVPMCYVETDDFVAVKPEKLRAGLTWLVEEAWLGKAGVKKEEAAVIRGEVKEALKRANEEVDATVREGKMRDLLLLPGVAADEKEMATSWRKTALLVADGKVEVLFKYEYMKKMAAMPMMKGTAEGKTLGGMITALENDPKAKKEIEGQAKVRELAGRVGQLGVEVNTVKAAKELQGEFEQLTVDYAGTMAGREAKDWGGVLEKRIKNTEARGVRTKGR